MRLVGCVGGIVLAVLLTCGSQAVIQTQESRKFDQQEVEDPFFRFGNVGELPVTQSSFFETNEACFLSSLPLTTYFTATIVLERLCMRKYLQWGVTFSNVVDKI